MSVPEPKVQPSPVGPLELKREVLVQPPSSVFSVCIIFLANCSAPHFHLTLYDVRYHVGADNITRPSRLFLIFIFVSIILVTWSQEEEGYTARISSVT